MGLDIEIVVNLERECLYAQYQKQCDEFKTKSQLFSNLNKTQKHLTKLEKSFLIQFLQLKIDFGLEIQHGKKNYTLKMQMSNTTYGFKHS